MNASRSICWFNHYYLHLKSSMYQLQCELHWRGKKLSVAGMLKREVPVILRPRRSRKKLCHLPPSRRCLETWCWLRTCKSLQRWLQRVHLQRKLQWRHHLQLQRLQWKHYQRFQCLRWHHQRLQWKHHQRLQWKHHQRLQWKHQHRPKLQWKHQLQWNQEQHQVQNPAQAEEAESAIEGHQAVHPNGQYLHIRRAGHWVHTWSQKNHYFKCLLLYIILKCTTLYTCGKSYIKTWSHSLRISRMLRCVLKHQSQRLGRYHKKDKKDEKRWVNN